MSARRHVAALEQAPKKRHSFYATISAAIFLVLLNGCTSEKSTVDAAKMTEFATRYAAAWGSQDAASVAAYFSEHGSLKINDGAPAVGRAA